MHTPLSSDRPADQGTADNGAVIHQTDRFRLFYRSSPQGEVLCKELIGPHVLERMQHEIRMFRQLQGAPGVPLMLGEAASFNQLCFPVNEVVALSQSVAGLHADPRGLLRLALQLGEAVAAMHKHGVVHSNLEPANIVLTGSQRVPLIIDFQLATRFAEAQSGFLHHTEMPGALAYLAPEQTGRTGRPTDYRADLYALGMILYELATGALPFDTTDVLQLIEDQLSRVPVPPLEREPAVPAAFSELIMRLLEKEPDRRYQSAEGLVHDLRQLFERHLRGEKKSFTLGTTDFPMRLAPPSRLFGRTEEAFKLEEAFQKSIKGKSRCLLIAGGAGVGKTSLINKLRPLAATHRGWFVSGKFDQYQHDAPSALVQALRALGRMLLAEPEESLASQRAGIVAALGPNVGLATALLPEFAILLGQHDTDGGDPLQYGLRLSQAMLDLLRAIASPARPLVIVLDDLQWAGQSTLAAIDVILNDRTLRGLLLVGAFRDNEVHAMHPLAIMLTQWATSALPPLLLRLQNLPEEQLSKLLQETLRLQPLQAQQLAAAVGERTMGNPFDTIELINALRQADVLVPGSTGWRWSAPAISRFIGDRDVVELLSTRIGKLPPATCTLLETMASIGGAMELEQLQVASAQDAQTLQSLLEPALADGLLTLERFVQRPEQARVQFRHDRVQQAAYSRLDEATRKTLHLVMARRLAATGKFRLAAAELFLSAADLLERAEERFVTAGLFREVAGHAREIANHAMQERYLQAALTLYRANGMENTHLDMLDTNISLHVALYSGGRHQQADQLFSAIEASCTDLSKLIGATCTQIASLVSRRQSEAAMTLAVQVLRRAGIDVPDRVSHDEVTQGLQQVYAWLGGEDRDNDSTRAETQSPVVAALGMLSNLTVSAPFFAADSRIDWFPIKYHQMWVEHGPSSSLVSIFGSLPQVLIRRDDYRTAYTIFKHGLAVGSARRYDTGWVRHMFALTGQHWFEPLELSIGEAQHARQDLFRSGDLQFACYSYHTEVIALLDTAPTLTPLALVVAEANAFAMRLGNAISTRIYASYQYLLDALSGACAPDAAFVEPGVKSLSVCLARAHVAAIFGDSEALQRHVDDALPYMVTVPGFYTSALMHFLHGLSLACAAQAAPEKSLSAMVEQLDECRTWLAARAADAPENFRHLVEWLDAERAWAMNDVWKAASLFDSALRRTEGRRRPWHRALLAERAGLFYLAHGLDHVGTTLVGEAMLRYEAWGAAAKVVSMRATHAFLRNRTEAVSSSEHVAHVQRASADSIDLLAIVNSD